jgi:menaquinone-9 beta-reductase
MEHHKEHHFLSLETMAICGAGFAGLIAGILLQKQGHKVVILERKALQTRPVCGEYLSPEGVRLFEKLFPGWLNDYEKLLGMMIVSPGGEKVDTVFPEGSFGRSLNRATLQQKLSDYFVSLGGHIFYGQQILKIERRGEVYFLETTSMSGLVKSIIGADGRKSFVAKCLDLKEEKIKHKRLAVHAYVKPKRPLPKQGQMHLLKDGSYIGINPIHADEVNFSIVTTQENVKKYASQKDYLNAVIKDSPFLEEVFPVLENEDIKTAYPISRVALGIANWRHCLIGDASGFIDPLTGEGMTTALKTAIMLADFVKNSSSLEEAYQKYAIKRKSEFRQKEKLNHFFQILITWPSVCDRIAQVLQRSRRARILFVGVIGNVLTPMQGLITYFNFKKEVKGNSL